MRHVTGSFARLSAVLIALTASSGGCAPYSTHVEADSVALGRVVVYRNGIAYYERRATVEGDRLTLNVPGDKVDDFLKSLTVRNAATDEPVPVSYPTFDGAQGADVTMSIQLPGSGPHDLILTYITEAPAWKPTYRVVVDDEDNVRVQGWAVVDNISGEDWRDVRIGVGSSSALSFRYDLRTVRNVWRETLESEQQFAKAPPTGGTVHGGKDQVVVVAQLDDGSIPRPSGHPDAVYEQRETVALSDASLMSRGGGPGAARPAPGDEDRKAAEEALKRQEMAAGQVRQLAKKLKESRGKVVIEGYADLSEANAKARSADRANTLRNELIRNGVEPARLEVAARGAVDGQRAGARLVLAAEETGAEGDAQRPNFDGDGAPIGESHFESSAPMTVNRGTSAMVSVLDSTASGEIVYLYAADAERGSKRYAFKALRLVNPTESTLETGPVTVYGEGRFIGEGLTDPVPPKATAVIPFAMDRQILVDRKAASEDRIARLITLQRGILTTEVQHTRRTELEITSLVHKPTTVYVRHSVDKGWALTRSPEEFEKVGGAYLFVVRLPARGTTTVEIEEATPMTRTVDVRQPTGLELVKAWAHEPGASGAFAEQIRGLLGIHAEMADHRTQIGALREHMGEYRARVGELERQIKSLLDVQTAGKLVRHLQKRLQEISDRVQQATLDVVDHQERLMMARIRFQDGISDLALQPQVSDADDGPDL